VENFAIDPIPFSDNYFDGVSAFDLGVFGGKKTQVLKFK